MWRDDALLPIPNLDIKILRHPRTKKSAVFMLSDAQRKICILVLSLDLAQG